METMDLESTSRTRLIAFYQKNIAEMNQKLVLAMQPSRKNELRRNIKQSEEWLAKLQEPIDLGLMEVEE